MSFANSRGGYGDFGGLGAFNDFESDAAHAGGDNGATPLSAVGGGGGKPGGGGGGLGPSRGGGRPFGGGAGGGLNFTMQQEMQWLKQDNLAIRNAVLLLEKEKDNLRQAVRKLKVENSRFKQKLKRLSDCVRQSNPSATGMLETNSLNMEVDMDYDEIGRVQDPLSLRFEVAIRDGAGIEHKSAERYYWYKMAEAFGDNETMEKILAAPTTPKAEEAMKEIKGFDENTWNGMKMTVWETGQRLKVEQVRWIANLLVYTGKTYIAVASQDKVFGTGWRKNRDESNKPIFWDGENNGGKALMKLRAQLKETHVWAGPYEEQETEKKYNDLKKMVWRRIDPARRAMLGMGGYFNGGMGYGIRGGRGGMRRGYGNMRPFMARGGGVPRQ